MKRQEKKLNVLRRVLNIVILLSLCIATVPFAEAKDNRVEFTKNMFDNTVIITLQHVPSGPTGEGLRTYDRAVLQLGAMSYAMNIEFASLKVKKNILGDPVLRLMLVDGAVELGRNVPYCFGFSKDSLYKRISKESNDGSGLRVVVYSCY